MRAIVLFSGGLDSTVLLYSAMDVVDVHALSFRYGSKHQTQELISARAITEKLDIPHSFIDLPAWIFGDKSQLMSVGPDVSKEDYHEDGEQPTVVPFRNGVFLSMAVAFAEARGYDIIYIASHASDARGYAYPDCTPEFTSRMAGAIQSGTMGRVSLLQPFQAFTKADVVRAGHDLQVPFKLTWSCYSPQMTTAGESLRPGRGQPAIVEIVHCGECATCRERRKAFREAGVDDPTKYATVARREA